MTLSLLAFASENNVLLSDPVYLRNTDLFPYCLPPTNDRSTIIMTEKVWETVKNFNFPRLIVISASSHPASGSLQFAADWESALQQAASTEETLIWGDATTLPQWWEKADRLYLTRFHYDQEGEPTVPLMLPDEWREASRQLTWTDATVPHPFSRICYQRGPLPDLSLSVVLSTCNQPDWLEKTLWGYEAQTDKRFELIIADDGSRKETYDRIRQLQPQLSYPVKHVWQEDKGFRKCDILNKGIQAAGTDYLLFSDGDCIPRKDFVAVHLEKREKGRFLSGGYHKLSMPVSKAITREEILSGRCFDINWLKAQGMKNSFKNNKLTAFGLKARLLNTLTTTKPTWNGHNASGWLKDILAANGFDERMQYGGQDREFGERLENSGIHGKQIRYSAICVHLDHARGYRTGESIQKNLNIRKHTRRMKVKRTPFGIV